MEIKEQRYERTMHEKNPKNENPIKAQKQQVPQIV